MRLLINDCHRRRNERLQHFFHCHLYLSRCHSKTCTRWICFVFIVYSMQKCIGIYSITIFEYNEEGFEFRVISVRSVDGVHLEILFVNLSKEQYTLVKVLIDEYSKSTHAIKCHQYSWDLSIHQ